MKIFATICLVAVATVSILGFSLLIDFQKTQAFFGVDAAIEIAFEFVKALAKALAQKVIAKFMVDIFTKLESVHTIANILNYSDALGFDVYIGSQLNSLLNPNKSSKAVKTDPSNTNVASIVGQLEQLPLSGSPLFRDPKKVEQLAGFNTPAKVSSLVFKADKNEYNKGDMVLLTWNVTGDNIFVQLQGSAFGANNLVSVPNVGSKRFQIQKSGIYYLNVVNKTNSIVIKQAKVELKVKNESSDGFTSGIVPGQGGTSGGLTPEQETVLLRGGLAMLTSAVSCGGVNTQAIQNLALYQATKARGFLMSEIDPRSGPDFYRRIGRLGNPYTSPQYQFLSMQDLASTVEAQARQASNLELVSSGNKVPRSASNTITSAMTTINSKIDETLDKLFGTKSEQGNVGFSGVATSVIAGFVSDLIVNAIFRQKDARLLAEKNSCGIPRDASEKTTGPNYQSPVPTSTDIITGGCQEGIIDCDLISVSNPFIRVNGKSTEIISSGENVTVNWSAGSLTGAISISVDPPPDLSPPVGPDERVGTRTLAPTEDTQITLTIEGETVAIAAINISTVNGDDDGGGGGSNTLTCNAVSPSVNVNTEVRFTATGGGANYTWSAPGGSPSYLERGSNTFTTVYNSAGPKTVTVTSGTDTDECSVQVNSTGGGDQPVISLITYAGENRLNPNLAPNSIIIEGDNFTAHTVQATVTVKTNLGATLPLIAQVGGFRITIPVTQSVLDSIKSNPQINSLIITVTLQGKSASLSLPVSGSVSPPFQVYSCAPNAAVQALPSGGRSIVLGEYYYPKDGTQWVSRGSKTQFIPGDIIIVKDSRATIGGSGAIPYSLNNTNKNIDRGTVTLTPAEFPVFTVSGGNPGGQEIAEQWAQIVALDSAGQSISADICYIDPDKRGDNNPSMYEFYTKATGLATVVNQLTTQLTAAGIKPRQ